MTPRGEWNEFVSSTSTNLLLHHVPDSSCPSREGENKHAFRAKRYETRTSLKVKSRYVPAHQEVHENHPRASRYKYEPPCCVRAHVLVAMVTVACSGWKANGGGTGGGRCAVTSVGGFPSGPLFYAIGPGRRVHGQAPAPGNDLLSNLNAPDEVTSFQLGFAFLPNSDEEQPPEQDQQL